MWIMWGAEAERLSAPSLAQRQGVSEPKGLNHANAPQDQRSCLPQLGGGYTKVEDLHRPSENLQLLLYELIVGQIRSN